MPFLVLDLEMTGSEPGWNEIIQIGACLYDDAWIELGRYSQNVYPENEESISSSAEEIHGISIYDLDEAPMMYDVLPEMENWIAEKLGMRPFEEQRFHDSNRLRHVVVCGQSVINDINFLKFAYRKEKLKWGYSYTLIDLHTLSYFLFPILSKNGQSVPKKLSLDAIAAYFGFEREGAEHNALEDAVITGQCFKEVFRIAQRLQLKNED